MNGETFFDYKYKIHKIGDHSVNFQTVRQDMGSVADKQFNAWMSEDGSYLIMERNLADRNDIITKYFSSRNSLNSAVFQTDWDARATLVYGEFNALFT